MEKHHPTTISAGVFNLRRFTLLLRRDFSAGYRGVLIAMAAVAGFVLLPVAGVTATVQIAVGLNFVVSLLAFLMYLRTRAVWTELPAEQPEAVSASSPQLTLSSRATGTLPSVSAFATIYS